ncbi:MAG: hypothetical protein ACOCWA_03660 [Bacteroidota bacterium]
MISFIANSQIQENKRKPEGRLIEFEGEEFYHLKNYDKMPPFLMSIVSDSDHWMYISSTGGLTAGRKNPDLALFPYYTDDKIHESYHTTGSITVVRMNDGKKISIWEPFSRNYEHLYNISRDLYKHVTGNSLIFEETNHDLALSFMVQWMNSEKYGWIRKTRLKNIGSENRKIALLDGIRNILPYGILKTTQEQFSTLMDAYKKNELDQDTNLGIFSMSSIPVDRAEPSEALKATTAWTTAENITHTLLSSLQIDDFRRGEKIESEFLKKGIRGAYIIEKRVVLKPGFNHSYMIILEVAQDSRDVINLLEAIKKKDITEEKIDQDVVSGTLNLQRMVEKADGIQHTGDKLLSARHFANVLFNIMRGGIFENAYRIEVRDFKKHLMIFNRDVLRTHEKWIDTLPDKMDYMSLLEEVKKEKDKDLYRLSLEYLPLTFSRRHGDPSRPWNRFSIDIKDPQGGRMRSYEGNWRDIFQNWEALSFSYPLFLSGMIAKFFNASTEDGYNPYRITSSGIDWEVQEPDNPWSFIGYWGDHQVIYILKLMELSDDFFPGMLEEMLNEEIFVYANVPYRIRSYAEILASPYTTIDFDEKLNKILMKREKKLGADGKLVTDREGKIIHVNLMEKILVSLLTKLSNFIPGAGIWMNTQRPEWNDANNALVGYGVSMVTLYYLRRYLAFLKKIMESSGKKNFKISKELEFFFNTLRDIFKENQMILSSELDSRQRKLITDQLGIAGSKYREKVYNGFSGHRRTLHNSDLMEFLAICLESIETTIRSNERKDKLFHAYNLINITGDEIKVENLHLMLEGQVSAISSGILTPYEVLSLLKALRNSGLYREDQKSYMLYPAKELPAFTDKNLIPADFSDKYPVLKKLMNKEDLGIINQDANGDLHFQGDFRNAGILKEKIERLEATGLIKLEESDKDDLYRLYEELFDHHSFTGRSGSFYKYEGLGSIYWHMVSKLLLSVGEYLKWIEGWKDYDDHYEQIKEYYYDIKEGIGVHKSPDEYGAIPTDPYSHTPSMLGVQQPGMTGQVKEDILSRWMELGLEIKEGEIFISSKMWKKEEFNENGTLDFTFCGTVFNYRPGKESYIIITDGEGNEYKMDGNSISRKFSELIFSRSDEISRVTVIYEN